MIALNLIICLFQFHTPFLQLNLHQRQAVDQYGNIIATLTATFYRNLIGNLKFILTPFVTVEKFKPYTLSIVKLQWQQIPQFLGFLKRSAAFKIEHDLIELIICKLRSAMRRKLLGIMFFQLSFEIGYKVGFLIDFNVFIRHISEGFYQAFFQCIFALSKWHLKIIKLRAVF